MRDTDDYDELRGKPIMVFSDPVERFESCINAYLVEKQRYYHYGEDMFASFGVDLKTCTKQEKIDYFFANFNKISSHHQLHHFHPQAWFVDQNKFKKFTVVDKHDVSKTFNVSHKTNLYDEIDALKNQNMMLLESLDAITQDDTFWSEEALKSGIVFKLKNVLTQIKNNYS